MKALCSVASSLLFFSISLPTSAAPARTLDLKLTSAGPDKMIVNWTTPVGASLLEIDVRFSTIPISAINWASRSMVSGEPTPTSGAVQYAQLSGLRASTTYYVGLKVRDATGWSLLSNVIQSSTTSAMKDAILKWTSPADDHEGQIGITGYIVCQSKSLSSYQNCVDVGNVTTYTFTGLTYGSTDYFIVRTRFDNAVAQFAATDCIMDPNVLNACYSPFSNPASKD